MKPRTATTTIFNRRACELLALGMSAASALAQAADPQPQPAPAPSSAPAATPAALPDDERTELMIILKDGRRFSGPVVSQNASEVVINIAGIPARFPTDQIDKLEVLEPLMERYRKFREAVGDDPDQIVRLAEWLQLRERYELALTEIDRALTIDKTHGPSLKLKNVLEQQIILKSRAGKPKPEDKTEAHEEQSRPIRAADIPGLTPEQIALIKVYETKLEEQPRLVIQRKTVQNMLEKYAGHPLVPITKEGREALLRRSPGEILDLMFKLQAREFYSEVEVLDPPRAFIDLRDNAGRTWLINSCATNLCHGGMEAGRLVLINRRPNSDRTVYTNFYIVSKFKTERGEPLIDWEAPERSALLQLGLPRERSRYPHPEVPRGISGRDTWRPVFKNTDDEAFKKSVEWIKSFYQPRPTYPIDYTPVRPFDPPPKPAPAPKDGPGEEPKPR